MVARVTLRGTEIALIPLQHTVSIFSATMLLANNEPSDNHRDFVAKKARDLTTAVLKVFWPSAKGSLHHACCVLDYLLRSYADQVRGGFCITGFVEIAALCKFRSQLTPYSCVTI